MNINLKSVKITHQNFRWAYTHKDIEKETKSFKIFWSGIYFIWNRTTSFVVIPHHVVGLTAPGLYDILSLSLSLSLSRHPYLSSHPPSRSSWSHPLSVCKPLLVDVHWHVHMQFIGEPRLWDLQQWLACLICFKWFLRLECGSCTATVLLVVASLYVEE